jgi:hypothetical protein
MLLSSCYTWPDGLKKTGGGFFYTAHWYENPDYKGPRSRLGSNDYYKDTRAAFGDRLIPIYCDDINRKEIPIEDIWFVKHPPKNKNNTDEGTVRHYYKNTSSSTYTDDGRFFDEIVAIQKCNDDGFCLLYKIYNQKKFGYYVRRQDIYKKENPPPMLNRKRADIPPDAFGCVP